MSKIPVFDIGDTLVPSRSFVENLIIEELRHDNPQPIQKFDCNRFKIYDPKGIQEYLDEYDLEGDCYKLALESRRQYLEAFEELLIDNNIFEIFDKCNSEFGTVGIISDNSLEAKRLMKTLLDKHGIDYDTIIVSDEVGVEKPDKRIFEAFLDSREEESEDFVYIGNDASRDIGAMEAGMDFIWTTEFNTVNSRFEGPKIEELTFENLKDAINRLEK